MENEVDKCLVNIGKRLENHLHREATGREEMRHSVPLTPTPHPTFGHRKAEPISSSTYQDTVKKGSGKQGAEAGTVLVAAARTV